MRLHHTCTNQTMSDFINRTNTIVRFLATLARLYIYVCKDLYCKRSSNRDCRLLWRDMRTLFRAERAFAKSRCEHPVPLFFIFFHSDTIICENDDTKWKTIKYIHRPPLPHSRSSSSFKFVLSGKPTTGREYISRIRVTSINGKFLSSNIRMLRTKYR